MKKAFTLIELLVVIAIIAILAAILFPVFAQAKLAAKKTQALSGVKQVDLALIMYLGDYDDQYPVAFGNSDWTGTDIIWQKLDPYTKSIGIFEAPVDSYAGQTPLVGSWAGIGVSFAVNSYYAPWCCAPNWNSGFPLRGPMGIPNQSSWLDGASLNSSAITQPAGTIAMTQKNGADVEAWNTQYGTANGCGTKSPNCQGNWSAFSIMGILGGDPLDGVNGTEGWGPERIPNGKSTYYTTIGNGNPQQFEYGINGAVSASYSGQSVFSYLDGHAKSMVPAATNPDPTNLPQSNQWDGLR
jgi:prepilin-type N-terminal cleavage/methylation domain-containing protein